MNKACLLILCGVLMLPSCKFHHIVSKSRPELQWEEKAHCIEENCKVWKWHATPENTQALHSWWAATEDFGTEDYWPKAYIGPEFMLHPRLSVRFSEYSTVFFYNKIGYNGCNTYRRKATAADKRFLQHLRRLMTTDKALPPEQAEQRRSLCWPPFPRAAETAYLP